MAMVTKELQIFTNPHWGTNIDETVLPVPSHLFLTYLLP
jgi:hypothetical protein